MIPFPLDGGLLHRPSAASYSPSCQADTTRFAFERSECGLNSSDSIEELTTVDRFKKFITTAPAFVLFTLLYVPIHLCISLNARRTGSLLNFNALRQWRQEGAAFLALNPTVLRSVHFEKPAIDLCATPSAYPWPRLLHWNLTSTPDGSGREVRVRRMSLMDPTKALEKTFTFVYPTDMTAKESDEFDLRVLTLLLKNSDCRKFHWSLVTTESRSEPNWARLLDLVQSSEMQCLSKGAVSPMTRLGESFSPWALAFSNDVSQMAGGENVLKHLDSSSVKLEASKIRCAQTECLVKV